MEQKKGLAALLQPSKTNDPNVWDSLAGKAPSDQLNDVKKELVKLTKISTDNLKEQRRSTKSLREIEKVITKPENVALPAIAPAQQKEQMAVKAEAEQKESANNESIFSSASLGGLGGAAAAAGALGVSGITEGASKVWDKTKDAVSGAASATVDAAKTYYKNLKEGKAEPGLAQVLDEQERQRKVDVAGDIAAQSQQEAINANEVKDVKAAQATLRVANVEPTQEAVQAQAAREAMQRGMNQRRRGKQTTKPIEDDVTGDVVAQARQEAYPSGADSSGEQTFNIKFSEATFAQADPENYKKFVDYKNKRYTEILEGEKKKGFSEGTAKAYAGLKAKKDAIIKFRKEIEAAGADKTNENQAQPAQEKTQSNLSASKDAVEARTQELLQKYPESMRSDPSVVRDAREEAQMEISAQPASRASSRIDDLEKRGADLRAVAAEYGMTGKVSGTYEGGQLTKIRDASGKEVDVSDRLSAEQKRNVNAARQLRAANERSGEMANQINQQSAENRELNKQISQPVVQPVVIQNNNNMSSQNFVPINAQPRVNSSFSKYQEKTASY